MNNKGLLVFFVSVYISVFSGISSSLSSDAQQPILLESDSAKWDDKTSTSVYRGNVKLNQGSLEITGDVLTVYAPGKKVKYMRAEGKRCTYRQINDEGKLITAVAKKIEHFIGQEKIILTNNAVLTQGEDKVASNKIIYFTKNQEVSAGTKGKNSGVRMTLVPKNEQNGKNK